MIDRAPGSSSDGLVPRITRDLRIPRQPVHPPLADALQRRVTVGGEVVGAGDANEVEAAGAALGGDSGL